MCTMDSRKHTHTWFANILTSGNVCNIPQSNELVLVIQIETCNVPEFINCPRPTLVKHLAQECELHPIEFQEFDCYWATFEVQYCLKIFCLIQVQIHAGHIR